MVIRLLVTVNTERIPKFTQILHQVSALRSCGGRWLRSDGTEVRSAA